MSLGVLNNLSAVYAENNLNNTSNSLSTVLQQLSSGSKINSGADDAAGLSMVDGLKANSMALAQSQTNASEGVGLLTVADGALSQVTNLLNRAVTLATEASNGTLNSSQDSAANSEYQSILSEINNIGTTTTYNNQTVFGGASAVNIYTGDSSTAGASIDALHIGSLSSSNVGDTGGVMAYSSGQSNVFIDLSKAGTNAAVTDSLSGSSTSITVNYMTKSSDGSAVAASTTISVGGANSTYANTAQGLISAINGAGLGLNASFGTAAQAGSAAAADAGASLDGKGVSGDTGIIITAQGIGVGGAGTNGAGVVGEMTVNGSSDPLSGTLNIVGSDGKTHAITLGSGNSTDNIGDLASTINKAGYGVTATVSGNVLKFTSASPAVSVSGTGIVDQTNPSTAGTILIGNTGGAPVGNVAGTVGQLTVNSATDLLTSGVLNITGDDGSELGGAGGLTLGSAANGTTTLAGLANFINSQSTAAQGISASVNNAGTVLTIKSAGVAADGTNQTAVAWTTAGAATTPATTANVTLTNTPTIASAQSSQLGTLTLNAAGDHFTNGDTLAIGSHSITIATGTNDTLTTLAAQINGGNYGVTASVGTGANANVLTFSSPNSDMTITPALHDSSNGGAAVNLVTTSNSTSSNYYSIGISGTVTDSSTGNGGTTNIGMIADSNGSGGVATISYSDGAGQSLSATDLLNATDAQATLNALSKSITAVAAQDGYIGAQINTLNAVSSVLSTQAENVTAAQNAVQATDYASATSNMSKYEILSQTGISALAQANSMQQEVTKLLQ